MNCPKCDAGDAICIINNYWQCKNPYCDNSESKPAETYELYLSGDARHVIDSFILNGFEFLASSFTAKRLMELHRIHHKVYVVSGEKIRDTTSFSDSLIVIKDGPFDFIERPHDKFNKMSDYEANIRSFENSADSGRIIDEA